MKKICLIGLFTVLTGIAFAQVPFQQQNQQPQLQVKMLCDTTSDCTAKNQYNNDVVTLKQAKIAYSAAIQAAMQSTAVTTAQQAVQSEQQAVQADISSYDLAQAQSTQAIDAAALTTLQASTAIKTTGTTTTTTTTGT